jgi:hypothetical protein
MHPRLTFALLALVSISACSTGTETAAIPPSTDAVASATTTTTVAASVGPHIEWTRIEDPVTFDGGFISAVTVGGPGFVAVGSDELPEDAAVWVSVDGFEWERIASDTFGGVVDEDGLDGSQTMTDVIGGPRGVLAVGFDESQEDHDIAAAVWRSADGRTWERVESDVFDGPGAQQIYTVFEWAGHFYAGGETADPQTALRHPAIWSSSDGTTWEMIRGAGLTSREGTISDFAATGDGLIATGSSGGHVARPTVWFSTDGLQWDVVLDDGSGDQMTGAIETDGVDSDTSMFMTGITATPDGFVAIGGYDFPVRGLFWTSSDGLFWTHRGEVTDAEHRTLPVYLEAVTATDLGMVAVGTAPFNGSFPPIAFAETWVSTDGGVSWQQVARTSTSTASEGPDAPWHVGAMNDVISHATGLLAVGYVGIQHSSLPGPFYRQAVWMGTWTE